MRKLHEILRLHHELGLARREIGRSVSVSPNTVADVLRRTKAAGLSWPLPEELDEAALDACLYPPTVPSSVARPEPDPAHLHRELKRKGVTLQLLWLEYKAEHPDGLQYTQFCERYRRFRGKVDVVMRQEHKAGEKLFVDYAGHTVPICDRRTGERKDAHIFVAVLGCSNYTYTEASWGEDLRSWLAAHVRCFRALGGVPRALVPDNLKSGVTDADYYEPDLNPAYADLARHYGCSVLPARVRKPRDKAKVEAGVLVVERKILAAVRDRTFFSLAELNEVLIAATAELNEGEFQKLAGSRQSWFETLDRPALRPLPQAPYEFAQWKRARVGIDYHLELEKNFYSVPYQLARDEVDVRYTSGTVEILFRGSRVASHPRRFGRGEYSTLREHMPESHRRYLEWSPGRLVSWAETVGPETAALVTAILERRTHPEHGYRACLGIMRLAKHYPPARMEAASRRALALGATSYRSVKSILVRGLDAQPLPVPPEPLPGLALLHENLRGPAYYAEEREA
ncbi:MAG: IS21 family transposase [Actinobacteria bacterium]|nr:IS21 family transposase [Actinomycetota bacterium]